MSTLTVELPDDLRAEVVRRTAPRGLTESDWIVEAVRAKLAADAQMEYMEGRAARGDRTAYEQVLARVPAADPVPGDER
jgi:Arc/MetJ family transcription regulator